MIDFLSTERAYDDHLLPIWRALPVESRGNWYARGFAEQHLYDLGVKTTPGDPSGNTGPIVVASFTDLQIVRHGRYSAGRPLVFLEHGAGQTYRRWPESDEHDRHQSNAGGRAREGVSLFLCPNEMVAELNAPLGKTEVIGCPKLPDLRRARARRHDMRGPASPMPTVAFSFHWHNTQQGPEADWAWPPYEEAVREFVKAHRRDVRILGHGHPRIWNPHWLETWTHLGVEPVEHFVDVVAQSDLLVADNSSIIFEACAVDLPVLLLNAPYYRKDVEHGLRFWEYADVGPQVDKPVGAEVEETLRLLRDEIFEALRSPDEYAKRRAQVGRILYGTHEDPAQLAADAILDLT